MAKQVVNTDRISTAANKLRSVNTTINSAFGTLRSKAQQIDNSWRGRAGEAARTTMYQLFRYNDARSTVLQNYISMLQQQVNPSYTNTETVNTKLADKFK